MDDEKLKELFGKYGTTCQFQRCVVVLHVGLPSMLPVWVCLSNMWFVGFFYRTCTQYPGHDWWGRQVQRFWLCQLRETWRCTEGGNQVPLASHREHDSLQCIKIIRRKPWRVLVGASLPGSVKLTSPFGCLLLFRLWMTWMAKNWTADRCMLAAHRRKGNARMSSSVNLNRWNRIAWPDTRSVGPFCRRTIILGLSHTGFNISQEHNEA